MKTRLLLCFVLAQLALTCAAWAPVAAHAAVSGSSSTGVPPATTPEDGGQLA